MDFFFNIKIVKNYKKKKRRYYKLMKEWEKEKVSEREREREREMLNKREVN